MKKFILITTLYVLIPLNIFSYLVTLNFIKVKTIDITYNKSDNLNLIKFDNNIHPIPDLAFKSKDNEYEIRYLYFGYNKDNPLQNEIMVALPDFIYQGIIEIIENDKNILDINKYLDSGVKKIYNADIGRYVLLKGKVNNFSKDYNFLLLNFLFHFKKGVVCQIILFNDKDILLTKQCTDDLSLFKFND